MESKERMLLEVILAVLFVVFLVLVSLIVMDSSSGSETEITNSFNTYNYANPSPLAYSVYPSRTEFVSSKPYIIDRSGYSDIYYYDEIDYSYYRHLRYDSDSRHSAVEGIFGNQIDKYEVLVKNLEYRGGYFKTTFYFEDYYGDIDSKSMTYYIPAREEKIFVLKDVSPSMYDYRTWWYETVSLTKASKRTHYFYDRDNFYN